MSCISPAHQAQCHTIIHAASASAAGVGGGLAQFLVGWIPIAGNIINAGTAASITEALGWALAEDFARETMAA